MLKLKLTVRMQIDQTNFVIKLFEFTGRLIF